MNSAALIDLLQIILLTVTTVAVMVVAGFRRDHGLINALTQTGLVASLLVFAVIKPVLPLQVTPLLVIDQYSLLFSSLAIIGGTPWIAGLAAINTPLRNQVIIGEKLDHSPWISAEDLKTKGAILLFSGVRENAPALCSGPIVKDILKTRTPDGQQITAFMCLPSS